MAAPELRTAIQIEFDPWQTALPDIRETCRLAVESAWMTGIGAITNAHPLADNTAGSAEVSVVFSSNENVHELNRFHRDKDNPTNVLSFPGDLNSPVAGGELLVGDIILAWETVEQEAAAANLPVADHTAHLLIHGVLHLLGYDHESDEDASTMERLEAVSMSRLGLPNPYGGCH